MRSRLLQSLCAVILSAALVSTWPRPVSAECTNAGLLAAPIPLFTGPNAHFIAIADFNEDGTPDLAVSNGDLSPGAYNTSLAVMIATGHRLYASPVLYPVGRGARGVVARDFNEDGITDLAVTNLLTNEISVLLGNGSGGVGNGTFAPAVNYPTGLGPFELVCADFNGDGILDLATCLNASHGVCVLPGLGSGGVGNGAFGPAVTFTLNDASTGLATGDFNADNVPDLVATENGAGRVGVLLGTGAGTINPGSFAAVAEYAAGAQPFHIEVADFNEDGSPDLAVANTAGGGVDILLGHPTGLFTFQTVIASGNSSTVASGDFNGDGILDIATGTVTGSNSGHAEVFLGQGSGGVGNATFGPGTDYTTNGDVYQLVVGDVDVDGALDVVTAQGYGNNLALLPGTCTPPAPPSCPPSGLLATQLAFPVGPNTDYVVVRDFNEDGTMDLAVGNVDRGPGSVSSSVSVLIGTGNRTFAAPVHYAVGGGACGLVAGDFNEDGIIDLAVAQLFANNVSVLIGHGSGGVGNGTFAPAVNYAVGSAPFELVTADFNGDGILDLATALNGTAAVSVILGLGSGGVGNGTFGPPTQFPIANLSTGLATGDFNHDGIPDLVATENYNGTVGVLRGTGSGTFLPAAHYAAGAQPFHIEVADFNEDGSPDLAVANTASGGIQILLGQANGSFVYQTALASGNSSAVAAGDLNHDGILDLVTGVNSGSNTGQTEVFLGQGANGVGNATFGSLIPYAGGADVYGVYIADVDQDGATDVVTAEGNSNSIHLLPGTCNASTPPPPPPPPPSPAPVLTSVRDVPNDNGGKVFVTWTASSLDVSGGAVNSYRVWRRIPPALASAALMSAHRVIIARPLGNTIVYWEALATLPAQRLAGYGYTAATTQDSLPTSNPYTAFFVSALTSNIDVFYSSAVDSGYSVDNLSPHPPEAMAGVLTPSGFALHWRAPSDPDLDGYRLYRGAIGSFVVSGSNLIAALRDTAYVDVQGHGEWYYKLSAVDIHGNESPLTGLDPQGTTDVGGAAPVFALHGAVPNPSRNGLLSIAFGLARSAGARLEVLDVAGRRIVARDLGTWGPGDHVVTLGDPTPLSAGVYFIRLIQDHQVLKARAVVIR